MLEQLGPHDHKVLGFTSPLCFPRKKRIVFYSSSAVAVAQAATPSLKHTTPKSPRGIDALPHSYHMVDTKRRTTWVLRKRPTRQPGRPRGGTTGRSVGVHGASRPGSLADDAVTPARQPVSSLFDPSKLWFLRQARKGSTPLGLPREQTNQRTKPAHPCTSSAACAGNQAGQTDHERQSVYSPCRGCSSRQVTAAAAAAAVSTAAISHPSCRRRNGLVVDSGRRPSQR